MRLIGIIYSTVHSIWLYCITSSENFINYFSSFDPSICMLTENEYESVSEEISSVKLEERAVVWSICKKYDDFLRENELYDENDLVRMMFEHGTSAEAK